MKSLLLPFCGFYYCKATSQKAIAVTPWPDGEGEGAYAYEGGNKVTAT